MEIRFKDKKMQKLCEQSAKLRAKFGELKAKRILMRLGDLLDAVHLYDVSKLPQTRLHPLLGSRKGQFAVDTVHPYRMILLPCNGTVEDLHTITEVEIISMNEDYH